nr:MAG TPA: hypothetical protein [Bacteriophage sp.]
MIKLEIKLAIVVDFFDSVHFFNVKVVKDGLNLWK